MHLALRPGDSVHCGPFAAEIGDCGQERQGVSVRRRVFVFMGGMSDEHEVSLKSGARVTAALREADFEAVPVTLHRDGTWQFEMEPPCAIFDAVPRLRVPGACVFIALHGAHGEDGRMQGLLEVLGLPYTGSGCAASALAMDKVRCKAVVRAQGLRVAGHVALERDAWEADPQAILDAIRKDIGLPCVIKPARGGSSVGLEIPRDLPAAEAALRRILAVYPYVMVEEFVEGVELTCSVLHADAAGQIYPLPVTEIVPKTAAFFDYHAKYTPGASEEITPARIPDNIAQEVQDMAAHAHDIVGCTGWSRSDFILGAKGPVWLEINTVPGLTETSLFPQAAAAARISYRDLCVLLVEDALRRHAARDLASGT